MGVTNLLVQGFCFSAAPRLGPMCQKNLAFKNIRLKRKNRATKLMISLGESYMSHKDSISVGGLTGFARLFVEWKWFTKINKAFNIKIDRPVFRYVLRN